MTVLVKDNEIKKYDGYDKDRRRRKFWRLSYDCYGPDYVGGNDGEGVAVVRQHEREDDEDYKRRKETTVPLSIVGPILRRFNAFVFRKDLSYDEETLGDFYADVDGRGTDIESFMSGRLLDAQIEGASYLLLSSTSDGEEKSKEQAERAGERITWEPVQADCVLQVRWYNNQAIEGAVLQYEKDGSAFVLWVDEEDSQRFDVEVVAQTNGLTIKVIHEYPVRKHGWSGCPLIGCKPDFGEGISQAAAIAELQKSITRYRSLLDEEIQNATYTQKYIFGENSENYGSANKHGSKFALFIPNPAANLQVVGGDPAQATSIRTSIDDDLQEAYRVAGIPADTGDNGPVESGVAKAFKFNDLASILKSLARSAEAMHKRAENLTAQAMSISEFQSVKYPDDFTMPIFEAELRQAMDITMSQLPQALKTNLLNRFVARNIELSDEEDEQLKQQLLDAGVSPVFGT